MSRQRFSNNKLSIDDQAYAKKASENYIRYEKAAEFHRGILSKHPKEYEKAYEEYVQHAPGIGYLPPDDKMEECIADCEKIIQSECKDLSEYLRAMNSAAFPARTLVMQATAVSEEVTLEMFRLITKFHDENPLVTDVDGNIIFDEDTPRPSVVSNKSLGSNPTSPSIQDPPFPDFTPWSKRPKYPDTLPISDSDSLSWDTVDQFPRTPISTHEIDAFRANPDSLHDFVFITQEDELVKVTHILTMPGSGKVFYVQDAGSGDAYATETAQMFKLLGDAERVVFD